MHKGELNMDKKLLTEVYDHGPHLLTFFKTNMDNLKKFGKVVAAATKLVGNDIGFMVAMLLDPRLKSFAKLEKMKEKRDKRKKRALESLTKNSDELMNSFSETSTLLMFANPGNFFTKKAVNGIGTLASKDFRAEMGEYGFDQLPVVGKVFTEEWPGKSEARKQFEKNWDSAKTPEEQQKAIGLLMTGDNTVPEKEKDGLITRTVKGLTDVFLWGDGDEKDGPVLSEKFIIFEAEMNDEFYESEEFWEVVSSYVKEEVVKNWPIDMKAYTKAKEEEESKIIDQCEKTLDAVVEATASTTAEEFIKGVDKINKVGEGEDKIDVGKLQSSFEEVMEKTKNDKNTLEELKKEFEKKKEEPTDEAINARIEQIILSAFKSNFLPKVKEGLQEFYESVYNQLSEGIEPEHFEILNQTEEGAEYVKLLKGYTEKMNMIIQKLHSA